MNHGQLDSSAQTDLWRAYRRAFDEFAATARQLQALHDQLNPSRVEVEAVEFALEKARIAYSGKRDAVAWQLLSESLEQPELAKAASRAACCCA